MAFTGNAHKHNNATESLTLIEKLDMECKT